MLTSGRNMQLLLVTDAPPLSLVPTVRQEVRALDHLLERLRITGTGRLLVFRDLHVELWAPDRVVELLRRIEQPLRIAHIDGGRSRFTHRGERGVDCPVHVGIGAEEIARDADARARQRVGLQVLRVVRLEPALALLRRRVRRIDDGQQAERHGDIRYAARHWAAGVEAQGQRDDAASTEEPVRRLQAGDPVGGRRPANGSAGVRAESQRRVRRRDRDAGAARRSRRRAREVVRIERLPAERALRRTGRELRHVQLREHDRACRAELLDEERVLRRNRSLEQHRAARRRQIERVVVVLEHDWNAVQRRPRALRLALGVERARGLERLGVERQHRAQRRPLAVVGVNPREAQLHKFLRRQRAGVERAVDVGDREGVEVHRSRGRCGRRRRAQRDRQQDEPQMSLHGAGLYNPAYVYRRRC